VLRLTPATTPAGSSSAHHLVWGYVSLTGVAAAVPPGFHPDEGGSSSPPPAPPYVEVTCRYLTACSSRRGRLAARVRYAAQPFLS
jgi:hypothetical protein